MNVCSVTPVPARAAARAASSSPDATRVSRRGAEGLRHNLPIRLTSFVGREREMAEVPRLLASTRLLTLTGVGGVGKTRLALEVAAGLLDAYPDGVWLVELGALADPTFVPRAVASAVGVREQPGRPLVQTLISTLRHGRSLLVLDNCEHLVQACAVLAEGLLSACPEVRVLATSQRLLGIAGEVAWRVPALGLPAPRRRPTVDDRPSWSAPGAPEQAAAPPLDGESIERLAEYGAIGLFLARARAALPEFALTDRNAAAVAEVCRRLDGIPLAIELAAARVRVLSVEQIAARLDDRFRLLTTGSQTVLPRHRTLLALVAWSYDLLSEPERLLLRQLSVFVGGWTLEAAEAVCATDDVLDLLAQLVDKSLVLTERWGAVVRYRMLETIGDYALGQLLTTGEQDSARRRHVAMYATLAEHAEEQVAGREQVAWLDLLEREHDNLRAALRYSVELNEVEAGLRLAGALWRFWQVRGHVREGRGWLTRLLQLPSAAQRTAGRAKALNGAGFLAFLLGDYPMAERLHREALQIRRQLDEPRDVVESLSNLGLVLRCCGDLPGARALFDEALLVNRTLGDRLWEARILNHLARARYYEGEYAAARALHKESLRIGQEVGDVWGRAIALGDLADLARTEGDHASARTLGEQSLVLWWELGDERGIAQCLETFAMVAAASSEPERAVRLLGAASTIREAVGEPPSPERSLTTKAVLDASRQALGEGGHAAAWLAGRRLSAEEATALVLTVEDAGSGHPSDGPARAADADLDALTPREHEVVTLIARGATNAEIAAELVIAEGTAANHVRNILQKLQFRSRTQVARWAAERDRNR